MEHNNKKEAMTGCRQCSRNRIFISISFFVFLSICLAIALIVVTTKSENLESFASEQNEKYGKINIDISNNKSVFSPLTEDEIHSVRKFLNSRPELGLVDMGLFNINESFIFISDLYIPNKRDVINFLDSNGRKPDREAHVVVYRGDQNPPFIAEYVVGPLPNPSKYRLVEFRPSKIPMEYRVPYGAGEIMVAFDFAAKEVDSHLGAIFLELFGGKLIDCGNKCLTFRNAVPLTHKFSGDTGDSRTIILTLVHKVEYVLQFPLYFDIFIKIVNARFSIPMLWFNGRTFKTFADLVDYYNANKKTLKTIEYPEYGSGLFSVLAQRGTPPMDPPFQNPRQVSPDGKRYSIHGRHVEYMFWQFYFRMDVVHGAQIYDVRFKNERIAYEIGMQEIAVMYSGNRPTNMFAHYLDTLSMIGTTSHFLFPGIDCPADATFIPGTFDIGTKEPLETPSAFCLFEYNTGLPLRRHNSYRYMDGLFYEGMENVVLTLRTIHTVVNYDYIVDFLFYQTGALEVKVTSTGYVRSSFFTPNESPYSFNLHENYGAPLHQHLFNFKVDVDVKGSKNRFSTLDIVNDRVVNILPGGQPNVEQIKFIKSVKQTEQAAAYNFDFDTPKYLVLYNEQQKDAYGNTRGYRILNRGMTKQLLPKGSGNEPMVSWARYQVAITKHNNSERTSGSIYSTYDQDNPVTNFQSYIDNDESIVDEDLVAWITIGQHHIPHTEDLPVTHSPAMDASFFLLPYNYFSEDPSIASKNAVRLELVDKTDPSSKMIFERYGLQYGSFCSRDINDYESIVRKYTKLNIKN